MQLLMREEHRMVIKNPTGFEEEYEILANFPFSSETKRMGIIVKHLNSQKIVFYLKGAETAVREKVKPS